MPGPFLGLRRPSPHCALRGYHPVAPSTAVEWRPPREDLVQWGYLPGFSARAHLNPHERSRHYADDMILLSSVRKEGIEESYHVPTLLALIRVTPTGPL